MQVRAHSDGLEATAALRMLQKIVANLLTSDATAGNGSGAPSASKEKFASINLRGSKPRKLLLGVDGCIDFLQHPYQIVIITTVLAIPD